jgi:hypothetical protein
MPARTLMMVQDALKLPSELAWKTRQAHADEPAEPEGLQYLIGIRARRALISYRHLSQKGFDILSAFKLGTA